MMHYQQIMMLFSVLNNEAEFKAVFVGLRVARQLLITTIELGCDSQLVASQLRGEYMDKCEGME